MKLKTVLNISFLLASLQHVENPERLKPLSKYMTVVIFASPLQRHKNILVENLAWPLGKKAAHGNGNVIVETIYKTYSKKLQNALPLRIICINATDSKGELPGETAKHVLKYLERSILSTKKKCPVDVIILPTFSMSSGKDIGEIMESLWYLREYVVLISRSSLLATIPSTETIAVGGGTEHHKALESVLDFVVSKSKRKSSTDSLLEIEELISAEDNNWLDEDLVQILAPAVVSAIALGILSLIKHDLSSGNLHLKVVNLDLTSFSLRCNVVNCING